MGNEMGNNNASGLQEHEKARTEEDQGKFLQDDNHADELKGENLTKLEAEEKDLHEKRKINESGEATDFHELLVHSETPLADLAVEKSLEENKTTNGDEEQVTEFKPLFVPVEIPPDSDDADLRSEDQKFVSSDISDFSEKTTTAEHGSKKEILIGRGYIETKNQTIDSEAGSGERDFNSVQQEVIPAGQVAEGFSILQSENGHLESNDVAENMYLCVKQETGDQNVATVMDTLLVKAKADEDEFETLSCEDKSDVFSPEEVDSQNEHNVDQSPLKALQPPQEAHKSAVEASYQQLEALNLPLEDSEAPTDALTSPLETLEPPVEAESLESPQEASHPQPLALTLLLKASDSPLEESEAPLNALNPIMETIEPLPKALGSPLEASDPEPLALTLLVEPSDLLLETSNSPLEASEPSIEASESPSEDSETPVEDSKSILETQLEASELPLEASDSLLEASESQLEALPQASSINSSQEVYEPHDKTINVTEALLLITSERQIGEIKLANNQALCSEENDQKFETFESKTSQSQQMCVGSNCYENDRENALALSIEKDYAIVESDVHSDDPQVTFLNQTLKPCLEEQPAMEESMLLTEENIPIGREVESKGNQGDHIKTQFCGQELKDLKTDDFIASQLEFLATEIVSKKSAEKSAHEFDFTNGTGENCQLEDLEVKCDEYQVTLVDKSPKLESSDVADTMSEIKAVSTESNVTDYKYDEDRPREEIGDKGKELPLENDRDRGDIIGKTMLPNSSNDAQDVPPYIFDSKALEDKKELITDSQSEFLIITERFEASPSVAIVQSMMPTPEQEAEQNIQETLVMAKTSLLLIDEETPKGEETVEKLMTEPSSDNASNHVEFRKSPSFHFDLSIGSKCEESDQTPLLCNDKTADRSMISRDEAMLQKNSVQIEYNSPQDDALFVEEKTIRMERSDSERPSSPFLSLLQKEESAEILVAPEKQENAADKKTKRDPWTVIHKTFALTSPRDSNGKRKAKSSIFSTCICCASKTP